MSDPLLVLEDLSVHYGEGDHPLRALDRVGFSLERSRAVGVVGESGSGKSTLALALMNLLGGAARIAGGRALFDGIDLFALPPAAWPTLRGRRIGLVLQDPFTSLNPALTVGRQLTETLMLHRQLDKGSAQHQALGLLDELGIPDPKGTLRAYPHALSGGMKQRALIAAALAGDPDLLILDEPTTALDVTIEAQILDLLENLRDERDLSMIFISHNLGVISRVVDDVCVLYAGQVVEYGPKARVFTDPAHPYTKKLLASMTRMDAPKGELASIPGRLPDLTQSIEGCLFRPRCGFAESRCAQPQSLVPMGGGQVSRCFKAPALTGPLAEETSAMRQAARVDAGGPPILTAQNVSHAFTQLDGLRALRLSVSGGLSIRYEPERLRAVDGVSLTIHAGETLGLVGESGCGKSTLGRCLVGLITPDAGTIEIEGRPVVAKGSEARRAIARTAQMVFQNPDSSLNPRKTVRQIIARPLKLFGHGDSALDKEIARLLDMVQLSTSYLDRYPHEMSGGEKQRVGIARALGPRPKVVICDEAVSALDVSVQASILNLLADLRDELGLAYLFISHDLSVVRHLSDHVAVMYRGAIVEFGPASEFGKPPHHPYTEALISAVPTLGGTGSNRVRLSGSVTNQGEAIAGCRFADRCPRKIGSVCDTEAPPWRESGRGGRFACHHPVEVLAEPATRTPPVRPFANV